MDVPTKQSDRKQDLSIGLMAGISETLAGLVRGMFGSGGQQTLLSTATGKVLVTRDGLSILSSLHLAHPIAHFIVQSLRSHVSLHHDGSKTFVLYLAQILKDIGKQLGREIEQNAMSRIKLSMQLNQFLTTDFQQLARQVVEKVITLTSHQQDYVSEIKNVVKSSLNTRLQLQLVSFFTDCLVDFLSPGDREYTDLERQLAHILYNFEMYHTKVLTQPQQNSRVCQGIMLEVNLQGIAGVGPASRTLKFALLNIDFEETGNANEPNTVSIHLSANKIAGILSQKRTSLEHVLNIYKSSQVDVLLCSDTVPQYVHEVCRKNGIYVHCLPHEQLMFFGDVTGLSVLTELTETVPTPCFFSGKITGFVHIGRKMCTMIELAGNKSFMFPFNHLILCAPTEGMCDQLCQALYKALQALSDCLTPCFGGNVGVPVFQYNNYPNPASAKQAQILCDCEGESSVSSFAKSALTIPCGGSFEAVLTSTILEYYKKQNYHPEGHVGTLVTNMLLAVPQMLCANLCSSRYRETRQFTEKWRTLLKHVDSDKLMSIDCHGEITQNNFVEPIGCKLSVVSNVLQLVIQLLRMDAVVAVKSLSCLQPESEHSDDRNEC